jgi:hypothetical protein
MPRAAHPFWTVGRIAAGLGLLAFVSVVATIDDPGLSVDEPLDVRPGREYVRLLLTTGPRFLTPEVVARTYADNAEHPPLGRWLLGIASTAFEPVELILRGRDPTGSYIRAGRVAPALAFAILVGLVAASAGRRRDCAAALGAGLGLLLMPRAFGHAHLAALDTFVALTWTAALLAAARAVESARPKRSMALAGLVWGLALLTKIHGWLLAPVVVAWTLAKLPPRKSLAALTLWSLSGVAIFFTGWPWLWYDTWPRFQTYLRTGMLRSPIVVQYLGRVFRDSEVPWHYPWLIFAATVPVGLHALGLLGVSKGRPSSSHDRRILYGGVILFWLILFSTQVPVYDGERLFLPVFPIWGLLIGDGWAWLVQRVGSSARVRAALAGVLAAQAIGIVAIHPFELSYYNALVGGLRGAERLGLELTYWGDSVDPKLLAELAGRADPDAKVALAPTLAPGQGPYATTPTMLRRGLVLGDQEAAASSDWIVIYRRSAYWTGSIRALVTSRPPVAVRARQGVWLSGLWRHETSGKEAPSN